MASERGEPHLPVPQDSLLLISSAMGHLTDEESGSIVGPSYHKERSDVHANLVPA
jgi:hypothetical protein